MAEQQSDAVEDKVTEETVETTETNDEMQDEIASKEAELAQSLTIIAVAPHRKKASFQSTVFPSLYPRFCRFWIISSAPYPPLRPMSRSKAI